MRIIFLFFFGASSTLIFKNPVIALVVSVLFTAHTNAPIESIAALAGTTLAGVLKERSQRQQINYVLVATVLHTLITAYLTQSVLQDLLVGFLIVLTMRGCLLL